MAAVAQGVGEASPAGVCIGLLPGDDASVGNQYLTHALATGLGELRNGVLVQASDAVLAVGGSWGTLSEIALGARKSKPVFSLFGWSVHASGETPPGTQEVSSVEEMMERLTSHLARFRSQG